MPRIKSVKNLESVFNLRGVGVYACVFAPAGLPAPIITHLEDFCVTT